MRVIHVGKKKASYGIAFYVCSDLFQLTCQGAGHLGDCGGMDGFWGLAGLERWLC